MAKLNSDEKKLLKELIKPVNAQLYLAWLMSVLATLIFVLQSWILATVISQWLSQQFSGEILSADLLWQCIGWLGLCLFLRPVLVMIQQLIGTKASLAVRSKLRARLLQAVSHLGMGRNQFGSDGSLSSQLIEQTDALDGYVSRFVIQKKIVASTPLILLLACAWQSPLVALILLMTAPLVPIFMILIGNMTAKKSAEQFSALAQLSGRFLDWVRGMTTLKRLKATDIARDDLSYASEDYRRRTMDVLKLAFLNGAVLEFLSALCIALVAVYLGFGLLGILPWDKGNVPVNYFSALFILLLTPEFYAPLRQLGMDYHAQAQAQGAVKSLLPVLEKAEEISKIQGSHGIELKESEAVSILVKNMAIYHSVFEDRSDEEIIRMRLSPISFSIKKGERVGLVGESGSGKSSLFEALMGFAQYEGNIEINNIDHHQLDMVNFRQYVGYLAQQVALMPISIADNLRLAKPEATDEELVHVLQSVELYELINQLPKGMDTILGERGKGLSGGQQHRLGIAQLLLQNTKLWLLDEPTEHLDPDTAERIHSLLKQVSQDKTVMWITHSIEQLPWLDRVIDIKSTK